nr:putative retrotransposon protein [Tanacetum cinerariifolium]
MENSKRGSIPMQEKLKLSKSQGASTPAEMKRMQNVPYALAVGSIMYAVRCTRSDVVFAQNITSRFQQNPGDIHWTTVKNILKYLRNTKDMFLVYGGDLKRELMNAKQSIFATSSAEVEYIAAFDASKEAVWVRKFISGLSVVPTIEEPISMYCDNIGAIAIANESGITYKGEELVRGRDKEPIPSFQLTNSKETPAGDDGRGNQPRQMHNNNFDSNQLCSISLSSNVLCLLRTVTWFKSCSSLGLREPVWDF